MTRLLEESFIVSGKNMRSPKEPSKLRSQPPYWLEKPKQKIDWALKLLHEKGHSIGTWSESKIGTPPLITVDAKICSAADIYKLVDKYPEWNDRLGLGTAKIRRVNNERE